MRLQQQQQHLELELERHFYPPTRTTTTTMMLMIPRTLPSSFSIIMTAIVQRHRLRRQHHHHPYKRKTLSSLYADQIVDEYGMNNGLRGEEKKGQEETTLKDLPPDDDNTPEANNGGFWAGLYQSLSRTAQSPLFRKNHDLYPAQNNDDPPPPHLAMTEEGSRAEQDSDLDGMSEWQSSDANADTSSSLGFDAGSRAGGDGESVGASQRPRP